MGLYEVSILKVIGKRGRGATVLQPLPKVWHMPPLQTTWNIPNRRIVFFLFLPLTAYLITHCCFLSQYATNKHSFCNLKESIFTTQSIRNLKESWFLFSTPLPLFT